MVFQTGPASHGGQGTGPAGPGVTRSLHGFARQDAEGCGMQAVAMAMGMEKAPGVSSSGPSPCAGDRETRILGSPRLQSAPLLCPGLKPSL